MILRSRMLHPPLPELGQFTKTLKPSLLNSLLQRLLALPRPREALQIYNRIVSLGSSSSLCDDCTYTLLLKACALLLPHDGGAAASDGLRIHARILKSGHHSDLFVQNSLLNFYASSGDVGSARRVFAAIAGPDVVSWTTVISALAKNGREVEALAAFAAMDEAPNAMTFVSVLGACSRVKALDFGMSVHGFSVRNFGGTGSSIILDNALLDLYMSCGDLISARNLFGEMIFKDVVSWTTLISGYANNGRFEEALSSFCTMLRERKVVPNEATVVSVLRACTLSGELRLGKMVHSYLFRSHIGEHVIAGNALINMYAKCGNIGMAWKVFNGICCKDLVSWCTILGGMALSGRAEQAVQLFALMLCHGIRPDGVAFLAMLTACCHAGRLNQALMMFRAMSEVYGISPQKEHYTCMIDVYGRAGRLKEAEEFLGSIPVEHDGHMWGALLSACKLHSLDGAYSKCLRVQLIEGKVSAGGGTYALMSNILTSAGRWELSQYMRDQMRARKIRKTVGHSWTELHSS